MDSADLGAVLAGSLDGFRAVVSVEQLSGGASQRTFRVVIDTEDGEQELAVRLASDASALEDDALPLTTEAELMTTTRSAGVPGPEVIHVLGPEDGLGDGFVMRWVDGETIGSRINHQDRFASIRPELAAQCGEALARIHSTDLEATGLGRRLETIPPPDLIQRTWDDYRTLGVAMPMIDFAGRWLSENLPRSEELRLVHGDFRNGNLIIDADAGIVAVLDWELAHIGDPMRDLGWVCTRSWRYGRTDLEVGGFGTVDDLLDGYESVSGGTIDREDLRYWEVFGSFWWAVACLRLADTHRSGADSSVERPAIGRRSSEAQIDLVALLIPGPVQLAEPVDDSADDDLPTTTALVGSVADHLADHLAATSGGAIDSWRAFRPMPSGSSVASWNSDHRPASGNTSDSTDSSIGKARWSSCGPSWPRLWARVRCRSTLPAWPSTSGPPWPTG